MSWIAPSPAAVAAARRDRLAREPTATGGAHGEPLELENTGLSYFRLAPNFRTPFGIATASRRRSIWSHPGWWGD